MQWRFCKYRRSSAGVRYWAETMKAVLAHARLLVDVVSMKIFVSILGHDGEVLDSHLFFFDRYSDLAAYHRQQGRIAKAERFAAIAEAYFQAAPDDEPPEAAAMAMPVPRPRTSTNAVSAPPVKKPSQKPSSERLHLVPSLTR
jgi:hypothetical protein